MDPACLFILTVATATAVYMSDRVTELTELNIGDRVCITEILPSEWMKAHWSAGGIGHTGFLHQVTAHKGAEPTAPMPYEEHEELPPPPQQPMPATPPNLRPQAMPPGRQGYMAEPQQAEPYEKRPGYFGEPQLPANLAMTCQPDGGAPYLIAYKDGDPSLKVVGNNITRWYHVIDRHDNQAGHTLYIAVKRQDQDRTLFFAFDYGRQQYDASAIRVKAPNGYDVRDKCFMNWDLGQ